MFEKKDIPHTPDYELPASYNETQERNRCERQLLDQGIQAALNRFYLVMNEQVAKDDKPYTHEEYSQFKQFLVSKNFAVADFERSIKDVKELPRLLRE